MTIEEAIYHCKQQAELKEEEAQRIQERKQLARKLNKKTGGNDSDVDGFYDGLAENCSACAAEHRQLAEWLKELKERRKLPEVILCKDCDNLKSDEYHHWCKSHGGFLTLRRTSAVERKGKKNERTD